MSDLTIHFQDWLRIHDSRDDPAVPAATAVVLRDCSEPLLEPHLGDSDLSESPTPRPGVEVLMVKRNSTGSFARNWVFPGGKVDVGDYAFDSDPIEASRRAASRETLEEAGLKISPDRLVPLSHWIPPAVLPRRFSTWFFLTVAPEGATGSVRIDGNEIVAHSWIRPADALAQHQVGQIELVPPTWMTLNQLQEFATASQAMQRIACNPPTLYATRRFPGQPTAMCWEGDAGYHSGQRDAAGARHRLVMDHQGWRLFRDPTPH